MTDTLQDMMREATRLTQAGNLSDATALIQRALSGSKAPLTLAAPANSTHQPATEATVAAAVIDGVVLNRSMESDSPSARSTGAGEFITSTHTHAGLTRSYKLYIPPNATGHAPPLVVMLHGCTQNPDDFAAGTDMNARAREQGFFVLYPAQSQDANAQRCWNWFGRAHQQRGSGEPALIADLTQAVMLKFGIDRERVYIAGLSAGGAMADIVAAAYPEIYAAVGIHSGLPRGAATNVAAAFAVMKNGDPPSSSSSSPAASIREAAVPTIVFHGDADQTVHPRNGEQVIAALLRRVPSNEATQTTGVVPGGHTYTRTTYRDQQSRSFAEHWLVKDANHAWSGGSAKGSYTDSSGPDATAEMLRFFFEHPLQIRAAVR